MKFSKKNIKHTLQYVRLKNAPKNRNKSLGKVFSTSAGTLITYLIRLSVATVITMTC